MIFCRWSFWHHYIWQVDEEVRRLAVNWDVWQRPEIVCCCFLFCTFSIE